MELELPLRVTITGHAKPALLQPQLTHLGHGWGCHRWSPAHLNGPKNGKAKERKGVMDCKEVLAVKPLS